MRAGIRWALGGIRHKGLTIGILTMLLIVSAFSARLISHSAAVAAVEGTRGRGAQAIKGVARGMQQEE